MRRFIGTLIVAICVTVPIVESFDTWDNTLQNGDDTEANVVVVALCLGFALSAVSRFVIGERRTIATAEDLFIGPSSEVRFRSANPARPVPTSSPPTTALRI